jgi:hypothetical protein
VTLGVLHGSHEAVHNLRVHPFENPLVICVEQADAMRATARERSGPEIRAIAHFTCKPANAFCSFGTSPMRFFDVAAQYSRDSRTRNSG